MRVDVSHRSAHSSQPPDHYLRAAQRLSASLASLQPVESIILCGSVAKNDVSPGWSDIDLILFCRSDLYDLGLLNAVKTRLSDFYADEDIGIGIDIIGRREFDETMKLCGRPYAMTYEVAAYGVILHGENPLQDVRRSARIDQCMKFERSYLIAAEVHSWRRLYVSALMDPRTVNGAFMSTKALLRILQYETNPNITPPFTHRGSLVRLRAAQPEHPALDAFEMALLIREQWPEITARGEAPDELGAIEEALQRYPLGLPTD